MLLTLDEKAPFGDEFDAAVANLFAFAVLQLWSLASVGCEDLVYFGRALLADL